MGLRALFASATLADLLRLFMLEPEREFYQRELQRLTGAHLRQLQRDLERLLNSGLVAERTHGNRVYYRAVTAHPAFPDLRAVVVKTLGVGDVLREAFAPLGTTVSLAFVFGSIARGDDTAASDVDLFIVGSVSRRDVTAALAPAAVTMGRELNPVIMAPEEFTARRRAGDHFVTSVIQGPLVWLVGDDAALAALA
jgi:uncharacterized protein